MVNICKDLLLHQLAIADAFGFFEPQALSLIRLVLRVVALEIEDTPLAFEGQDVGADTVEEPTVVADDDGTAGKGLKTFLKSPEGVDVDIVRGLVEQQHIAFLLQGDGQMQAVTLTAREHATLLLLVGSAEVEAREVG